MFKIVLKAILLLCLATTISSAQLRKASEYFPLQVGNIWEYDHPVQTQLQRFEVISDTLLVDSVLVYKAERQSKQGNGPWLTGAPYYYHYNSDSTIVYKDEDFPDTPYSGFPMIDTGRGIGHRWQYLLGDVVATFAVTDTGSVLLFNRYLPWLEVHAIHPEYDSLVIVGEHMRFVAGIGPTEIGRDTLTYAKIDGAEYGEPVLVGIEHRRPGSIPDEIDLQIYPNPFSRSTTISLANIRQLEIEINVIDVLGRTVRTFNSRPHLPGSVKILWDGKDDKGSFLPMGVYFVTVKHDKLLKAHKVIHLRK